MPPPLAPAGGRRKAEGAAIVIRDYIPNTQNGTATMTVTVIKFREAAAATPSTK